MAIIIGKRTNLDAPIKLESLYGVTFTTEAEAHQFVVRCEQKGQELTLSGTISAKFVRADGNTVQLVGSISDGAAVVTLAQDCYNVPGRFQLAIFNTVGDTKLCIYACVGTVQRAQSGNLIDGGDIIPDVEDLIADIQAAVQSIPPTYDALLASIAGTYSASKTYAVGDYVWYDGSLYRCTTAITTAEAWTSAHWTAAVLGDDVSAIKSAISQYMITPDVTVIDNYYVRSDNGYTSGSESYVCTDYIDLNSAISGTAIFFRGTFYSYVGAAFYNASKQYISGVTGNTTKTVYTKIPSNARYLRITLDKTKYIDATSFGVMYQNDFRIEDTNEAVASNADRIDYLEVGNGVVNGYQYNLAFEQGAIGGTGVPYASTTDIRTDYIPVLPSKYKISLNLSNEHFYVFLYDKNKTFLRTNGWNLTTDYYLTIQPNSNVAFLRIVVNYGNQTEITPVDNAVLLSIEGAYDELAYIISDTTFIPSYYQADNYLQNKIDTILENCVLQSGTSFVFITDLHLADNSKSSKGLVKHCIDNAPIPFVLTGGDIPPAYSNTSGNEKSETLSAAQEWLTWIDYWGQDRVYQMRGNHDYVLVSRTDNTKYYNMIPSGVRQYVMSKFEARVNTADSTTSYYYFDDESQKIRFIVLDAHANAPQSPTVVSEWFSATKINWLIDILNNSDDYHIVILTHEPCDSDLPSYSSALDILQVIAEAYVNRSTVSQVASGALIQADFTSATGELVCILSGHAHEDASHASNGVLGIVTTCDALYGNGRTAGSITESAFDVFAIDTTNKTIKAVRIGVGNDRSWYYKEIDGNSVGDAVS